MDLKPRVQPAQPRTIDDYLAPLPDDRREALQALRQAIHRLVPDLQECISYAMPAFRRGTEVIAGFSLTKAGCSYYPFSSTTLQTCAADVEGYSQTKGALHFSPERPLAESLVHKLLWARIAEVEFATDVRPGPTARGRSDVSRSGTTQTRSAGKRASKAVAAELAEKTPVAEQVPEPAKNATKKASAPQPRKRPSKKTTGKKKAGKKKAGKKKAGKKKTGKKKTGKTGPKPSTAKRAGRHPRK